MPVAAAIASPKSTDINAGMRDLAREVAQSRIPQKAAASAAQIGITQHRLQSMEEENESLKKEKEDVKQEHAE